MKTPELDKMLKIKDKSQIVGEFLEWMNEQGYCLAEYVHDRLCVDNRNREELLAEFFEINLDKAEKEKLAILEDLRRKQ